MLMGMQFLETEGEGYAKGKEGMNQWNKTPLLTQNRYLEKEKEVIFCRFIKP